MLGLVIGAIACGLIISKAVRLDKLNVEREARLQDALKSQLTASEVRAISRRTARLEAPTDAEVVDQITDRLRRCLRFGGCRRTIRETLTRVLSYAEIRQGPRGQPGASILGPRGPRGAAGPRGQPGRMSGQGPRGTVGGALPVAPPRDPQTELNARLLQDLDELVATLTGRVDRLSTSLRCVVRQPLNLLRCL
jgi:hypothetical protein